MHVLNRDRQDVEWRRAILQRAALFHGCSTSHLTHLAQATRVCRYPADGMIVTQDEPATELYILASGCVRVLLCNDEGREFTLGELQRDEFFGEAALLGDATYSTSVVAVEDVQLLALSRSALFMHLRSNPATGGILAVELARRACAAQQIIGELALLSVESRVVRALLRLAHRDGEVTESGVVLRNRRTHQELANMVGISRETLTRTFSSLAKRGLLSSRGNRLMLSTAIFRHTAPSRDANCE